MMERKVSNWKKAFDDGKRLVRKKQENRVTKFLSSRRSCQQHLVLYLILMNLNRIILAYQASRAKVKDHQILPTVTREKDRRISQQNII